MALTFYASVAKWLKLKVRKIWKLIPTFEEVKGEKLVVGFFFCARLSQIGLRPTIIPKIFEINSSFHVKQHTTGKVQFLFFWRFLLVLTKFSFQERD